MDPAAVQQQSRFDGPEIESGWSRCLEFLRRFDFAQSNAIYRILKFAAELLQAAHVVYNQYDDRPEKVVGRNHCHYPSGVGSNTPLSGEIGVDRFTDESKDFVVYEDLRYSPYWEENCQIRKLGIRAYLGCPVRLEDRIIGGVAAYSTKPRQFGAHQLGWLRLLAVVIAFVEQLRMLRSSMEDRMNKSEPLNHQMVEMIPAAIYKIDLIQQRFVMVNQQMCRATGYSQEELLALNPLELLAPQSRQLFMRRCRTMAIGKPVSSDVEYEIVTKSGETQWAHLHILHLEEGGQIASANVVANFITEQKKAREELAEYRKKLEMLVKARTADLDRMNAQMREEIVRRAEATERLRISSDNLQEMNTAMRVLLDKRTEDQQRAEEIIRMNLKELIDPYLDRLAQSGLNRSQEQLLDVVRMNLEDVLGSAVPEFSSKYYMLSPNEIQVVNLVRKGKTTKEMSRLLNLSVRTVEAYRNSIRKKLNLKNKKINLRTYLASI
jgi:PAS domain S-box-containing protein